MAKLAFKGNFEYNPRGDLWAKDENTFGKKLLRKMGWSAGKGLGKNEDGNPNLIPSGQRKGVIGLGYKDKDFFAHQINFNKLLESLQFSHSDSDNERKLSKLEKQSKKSTKRIHYSKLVRGKDLSNASAKDLASIFGTKKAADEETMTKLKRKHHQPSNPEETIEIKKKRETFQVSSAEESDATKRKRDERPKLKKKKKDKKGKEEFEIPRKKSKRRLREKETSEEEEEEEEKVETILLPPAIKDNVDDISVRSESVEDFPVAIKKSKRKRVKSNEALDITQTIYKKKKLKNKRVTIISSVEENVGQQKEDVCDEIESVEVASISIKKSKRKRNRAKEDLDPMSATKDEQLNEPESIVSLVTEAIENVAVEKEVAKEIVQDNETPELTQNSLKEKEFEEESKIIVSLVNEDVGKETENILLVSETVETTAKAATAVSSNETFDPQEFNPQAECNVSTNPEEKTAEHNLLSYKLKEAANSLNKGLDSYEHREWIYLKRLKLFKSAPELKDSNFFDIKGYYFWEDNKPTEEFMQMLAWKNRTRMLVWKNRRFDKAVKDQEVEETTSLVKKPFKLSSHWKGKITKFDD